MWVKSVTAHAFGPLVDDRLTLSSGFTVIVGPNESAKSSWHAAIYAALCGRKRGRGSTAREDRRFRDMHRPWDRAGWEVSAVVALADGRCVELRHDLEGKVDCRAVDLQTGVDVSAEVMHDGAPDAARWLGLDRRSFLATAGVSQAQLLQVREAAEGLQTHLQRAAATASAGDATAAAALDRLDRFAREQVGSAHSGSGRPLRTALERRTLAARQADDAAARHQAYLIAVSDARAARAAADEAQATATRLAVQEAALQEAHVAAVDAARCQAELARVEDRLVDACASSRGASPRPGGLRSVPPARTVAAICIALVIAGAAWWPAGLGLAGGVTVLAALLVMLVVSLRRHRAATGRSPGGGSRSPLLETAQVLAASASDAQDAFQRAASQAGLPPASCESDAEVDLAGLAQRVTACRATLSAARTRAAAMLASAAGLEGAAGECAKFMPDVAEAEEALARADSELRRVREMQRVLALTREHLVRAEHRVHRDLAPVLSGALSSRLSQVTNGRYLEALVDPATLQVSVCGPDRRWRNADRLSVGTAEQIYLLLRIALADHLTVPGESCPLLLDDVTVQADEGRTKAILEVLFDTAAHRQVVLFTQEPAIAAWASERFARSERHSVLFLPPIQGTGPADAPQLARCRSRSQAMSR